MKGSDLQKNNHSWKIFQEVEQSLLKKKTHFDKVISRQLIAERYPWGIWTLDINSWEETVAECQSSKTEEWANHVLYSSFFSLQMFLYFVLLNPLII